VVERMAARKLYNPDDVKLVWESKRFPTTSYTLAHNLDPALAAKIKEAFFSFPFKDTALGKEFKDVSKFVPITYKTDWEVIRDIQKANKVEYTPQNLK
jgi:phosphonate transport system substrate-binding protein